MWAHRILGRRERELFAGLALPEQRQLEWLGARTAAKEAVRELLPAPTAWTCRPPTSRSCPDERGRPWSTSRRSRGVASAAGRLARPHRGRAAALAVLVRRRASTRVGIDIELLPVRSDGFVQAAFADAELQLPATGLDGEREEWLLRCWCAKEAAAKALGTGHRLGRPQPRARSVSIPPATRSTGQIVWRTADAAERAAATAS